MKIKERYRKFLKLWSEKIELQRYVTNMYGIYSDLYESYNNQKLLTDYWLVIGGRHVYIGGYDNLGEFYWNKFSGTNCKYKFVKVLVDLELKDRIKNLCELKKDTESF